MIHPNPSRSLAAIAGLILLAACSATPAATPPSDTPAASSPTPAPVTPDPASPDPASPPPTAQPGTPEPASPAPSQMLTVVASTTVLADLVRQVGGERVDVRSMMPAGRDPHTFEPAPGDAAALTRADLLVMNGLGLDEWLEDLAGEVAAGVPLLVLGEDLDGVEYLEGHDHDDEHGHDEPGHDDDDHDHAANPHLWLDVSLTRLYVARLAEVLAANDGAGAPTYDANAAAYDATLAELDDWIGAEIDALPAESRRVVSFHDAFPYYGRAYGIEIVGVVVPSPGQEPSAAELARLIGDVREANARAVLTEIQFSDGLARVVADETGIVVVDELYTDSLGDPPIDTYEAMMRWNTERIVEALR